MFLSKNIFINSKTKDFKMGETVATFLQFLNYSDRE